MPVSDTEIKEMKDISSRNAKELATTNSKLDSLISKLEKTPDYNRAGARGGPNEVTGVPWARRGEDALSSRGFSFMKMLGVMSEAIPPEQAKVEIDISNRLRQCYGSDYSCAGNPSRLGHRFLMPLATSYLDEQHVPQNFRHEMKSLVTGGVEGADWDEMNWIRRKQLEGKYGAKSLSWLSEDRGGSLVAPPEMGELIELLRNKEALVNAGARTVPLPPQGRIQYPRQTTPSNTYWVGENSPISDSNIGTGTMTLQAKKLAVLIKAPNELIRFASPAAEALIRDDMTKSLALGLDLACLEGQGTDTRPRGVINMPGITTLTSSKPGANGDFVVAEDLYRMIAAVEEANAEFKGYIMRPKTLHKYFQLRFDAVAQGDKQGGFLFNLIREAGDGQKPTLAGFPATTSTQVSQNQTKGTSTNLTYVVGGMWDDFLIGMFGAIEFASTTLGDTSFQFDQTWVRGILSCDCNARHEAAFVYLPNLGVSPPNF